MDCAILFSSSKPGNITEISNDSKSNRAAALFLLDYFTENYLQLLESNGEH